MDNLCHTLAGAALAEAGLKRHTRFGGAALMVAANLPDVDAMAFFASTPSVALRRGWTHGLLAQAVLPIVLTAIVILCDRWRPSRAPHRPRVHPVAVLLLCYAGVLSHVAMDWLNNYGVRLLMPFSGKWFYGDALFIIDPWLWVTLGAGVLLARRRRGWVPAAAAAAIATSYMVAMTISAQSARQIVVNAWTAAHGGPPMALMVGPLPVNPFRKSVIIDAGEYYQRGTFRWLPVSVQFDPERVPKRSDHPAVRRAQAEPAFRALLVWTRFPYYEIIPSAEGARVRLADMRFGGRGLFTVTTIVPDRPGQ
jgi:inner membrane protein